jgi:hypothetical protein
MLCRVSKTLGKGPNTLGKIFTECHTRQRVHDKILVGKEVFAERFLSGTRQKKNKKKAKKIEIFLEGLPIKLPPSPQHYTICCDYITFWFFIYHTKSHVN